MTSIAQSGFWQGRRVLVTGSTGFKGAWLCALLARRGAAVAGLALPPPTDPSLWELAAAGRDVEQRTVDLRDAGATAAALDALRPQTIFHLAAQSLVRAGYADPVATYATNVMGTVHLLDAVRHTPSVEHVVVVTSDKVYADRPQPGGYDESAPLGGADPYAGSKACAELVAQTYRSAFFSRAGAPRIATARAGNVIGGGDFSADRLIPDAYRAIAGGTRLTLRRPDAVRPWQHVLEPLYGYVALAEAIAAGTAAFDTYNFGPADTVAVRAVAERFVRAFGLRPAQAIAIEPSAEHETAVLEVDSTRAHDDLGWTPRWNTGEAVDRSAAWYRDLLAGTAAATLVARDLDDYEA